MADLTDPSTEEGWPYLATVFDAFSRKVVGWAMGERPTAELVIDALNMAVWNRRPVGGLVHHSDHGAQYTSLAFSRRLEAAGTLGSMGSLGDALDNAVAESFFATLRAELLDRRSWPTRQALKRAVFEYIEVFYNPPAPLCAGVSEPGGVRKELAPPPGSVRYGRIATDCPQIRINSAGPWRRTRLTMPPRCASSWRTRRCASTRRGSTHARRCHPAFATKPRPTG